MFALKHVMAYFRVGSLQKSKKVYPCWYLLEDNSSLVAFCVGWNREEPQIMFSAGEKKSWVYLMYNGRGGEGSPPHDLTVDDAFKNCLMQEQAIEGINAHI